VTGLDDTVALVTGASSGIGEATARRLARRGAAVALVARRPDRLAQVASDIEREGGRALVVQADVALRDEAEAAVERTVGELGRLDILVNNAGVMRPGPALESPVEEWQLMLDVNVAGVMYVTHAALPQLVAAAQSRERGVADVVNVSSTAGRQAGPRTAAYSFTKFGLIGFSDGLRLEFKDRGVRVCVIEPGRTVSELGDELRPEIKETAAKMFAHVVPLDADDVAEAIEFAVTRPAHAAVDELLVRPTNG
jgi:NADP-dependent 3-hydroxy acid dehydrogenase YdfG